MKEFLSFFVLLIVSHCDANLLSYSNYFKSLIQNNVYKAFYVQTNLDDDQNLKHAFKFFKGVNRQRGYVEMNTEVPIIQEGVDVLDYGEYAVILNEGICDCDSFSRNTRILIDAKCKDVLRKEKLRLDSRIYTIEERPNDAILIKEVYGLPGDMGGVVIGDIGIWSEEDGWERLGDTDEWKRRVNLRGIELKIAVNYKEHLENHSKEEMEALFNNGQYKMNLFYQEILNILGSGMNFTMRHVWIEDGQWGQLDPDTGEWTGIVRALKLKEADVGVDLSVIPERAEVVDFSRRVTRDIDTLWAVAPKTCSDMGSDNFWAYTGIFTWQAWLGTVAMVAGLCTVASAPMLTADNLDNVLSKALGMVGTSIVQRDVFCGNEERSVATKILLQTVTIFAFVTFAVYAAVLTSLMTACTPKVKITSMWDVLESPYRVIVKKGTANYFSFSGSLALEQYRKVYKQKMSGRDDAAVKDSVEARAIMMKDPRVLFFSSTFSFFEDPDVIPLKMEDSELDDEAYGFQKNSDLVPIFNYQLSQMEEYGVLDRIRAKWGLADLLQNIEDEQVVESSSFPLGFGNVFFPFFILIVGSVASAVLGFVEWIKRTIEKQRNKVCHTQEKLFKTKIHSHKRKNSRNNNKRRPYC